MEPSPYDIAIPALCAWRENRGGGRLGMQSVLNVLANRAQRRNSTLAREAVRPWQFSSMTALNDSQLVVYPSPDDPQFATALELANEAIAGTLEDLTSGATMYYALSMKTPPAWAASYTETATIQGQIFFKAVNA